MPNTKVKGKEKLDEVKNSMIEAVESGDSEKFAEAQVDFGRAISDDIMEQFESMKNVDMDQNVMASRGLQPLTKEETTFYNGIIENRDATLENLDELMPKTIIDRVFEDLEQNYPLLKEVNFVNTTGVTEWVTRTSESEAAWWGKLCSKIEKKLEASFKIEDTTLFKLSAYVPICKAMLKLGPVWLDKFVRTILAESIYMALEDAIIAGDGDDKPIGMLKNIDGSVTGGKYPNKQREKLADLSPKSLGTQIMSPLTKEGTRPVDQVLLIVNPLDYWAKIFPQTTYLNADRQYVYGVLPINAKIIQSAFMPKGTMVAGIGKDYDLLVGSTQKIEYSDHYRFLEDERVYITKQYANGKPKDNDSFLSFNIEDMDVPEPPTEFVE